ncbi:hypothetical protein Tco_1473729 [Tanacetum coccineum]
MLLRVVTMWVPLPKDIMGDSSQRHTGCLYPKTYWVPLPKDMLGASSQRYTWLTDDDGVRMMMVDVVCHGDGGDVTSGVGVVRRWWWPRLLQAWCGESAATTLVVVVAAVVRWLWGDDGVVVASEVIDRVDRR